MDLLSNLFTYGGPGLLYTLSLISIHKRTQPQDEFYLKLFTFLFALIHITAFMYPNNAMAWVVLITQSIISLLLIRNFTKDAIIVRMYYVISIIILIEHVK